MRKLFLHTKSGNMYEVLHIAVDEKSLVSNVVYRDVDNGLIWIRPVDEFFDGRFKEVYRRKGE